MSANDWFFDKFNSDLDEAHFEDDLEDFGAHLFNTWVVSLGVLAAVALVIVLIAAVA